MWSLHVDGAYSSFLHYSAMKLLLLLSASVAATAAGTSYDLEEQQRIVKTNQAKWNTYLNNTSCGGAYVMTFTRGCLCFPEWKGPYQVVVNSTGDIASAIFRDGVDRSEYLAGKIVKVPFGKVLTIRDVFDKIKRALNVKAYSVELTYDDIYGYPKDVHIDYDEWTTDDVDSYMIDNVIPL